MLWVALLAFMYLGGGSSYSQGGAGLTVRRGGDELTYRWVSVSQGAGRTAFAVVREEETDTGNVAFFRSACFPQLDVATARLEQLLAMSPSAYAVEAFDDPAIDCGSEMAKRLLDEFYPGTDA